MRPFQIILSTAMMLSFSVATFDSAAWGAAAKDLKDKVVLANPDKYPAMLKFGTKQRNIQPRKASVLSPKRYPLTIEYWSGKRALGWTKTQLPSAGVYYFRWQGGQWSLSPRPSRATPRSTARRTTTKRSPSYRQSTGSYRRVVRGSTYARRSPTYASRWNGGRWPFWVRGVWGVGRLYQFIRDEEDRDVIRDIIIGREVDDTIRREVEDALRDRLVALPHDQQRDLERAIDDISHLNPDDWKDITTLPADDWDRLRGEIGDQIGDADWEGLGRWVDTMDEGVGEGIGLDDAGIDTMDENLDIDDVDDMDENLDLDVGENIEDIDLGDIAGEAETLDLSDFDDGGYEGGVDMADIDTRDVDIGDVDDGGGWDNGGGLDMDPGDYDAGGFDDWGGGGFDGGGADDFGGGFDDFGGGGDFFDF